MHRSRSPRLLPFALLSLAIHVGAAGAVRRAARGPEVAFDVSGDHLAALTGDTLDVEPSAPAAAEDEALEGTGESTAPAHAPSPRAPPEPGATPPSARARPGDAANAAAAEPALFGAVGVRSATDLATTFTKAFPQAASADPLWVAAPFGSTGAAEVTLLLDDGGHIANSSIGGSPSPALRRGIERTLVLLGARPFTAHGAVTRLRIRCNVSRNDVHDGLHGDVFALSGGSFSGDVGTAFFALPPSAGGGRRVDVELRLLQAR
jgi:hypothetical protein